MTIKIQSKSQYAFAIFLAGSVCGLTHNMQAHEDKTPADQVETTTHRLQITGATQQILAAIDNSVEVLNGADYPAGTVIVGGPSYTANTNDLTSISLGIAAVEGASFAASASLAALAGLDAPAGTAIVGGPSYTANTNDLTSLSLAIAAIEGTSFATASASLFVIARQTALAQVMAAASHPAIATNSTTSSGGGTIGNFNTTLANLRAAIIAATAVGGQTNTLIDAITTTANLAFTSAATETISAPFTQASCQAALQALSLASINWSVFYS